MRKIVIDPGHGGRDPGAIGPSGVQEKIITLNIARLVAAELRTVVDVRLTRDDDRALGDTPASEWAILTPDCRKGKQPLNVKQI